MSKLNSSTHLSETQQRLQHFSKTHLNMKNLINQYQQTITTELSHLADLVELHSEKLQKQIELMDQSIAAGLQDQHLAIEQLLSQINTSLQKS